ncbi:unnamed protein product, partial [Effrenium voratum]
AHIKVLIQKGFIPHGEIMTVYVKPTWKLRVLRHYVSAKWGYNPSWLRFVDGVGNALLENLSFRENHMKENQTITLLFRLQGGVINRFLKREEAVPHLKNRATKGIIKTEVPQMELGQDFDNFISSFKRSIDDIKMLRTQGVNVIESGLRQISESDLSDIKQIMSYSKRNGTTEQRLPKLIEILFPHIIKLTSASKALTRLQEETVVDLIGIYVEQFHSFTDGQVQFQNEPFLQSVEKEIIRRSLLNNQVNASSEQEQARCLIS